MKSSNRLRLALIIAASFLVVPIAGACGSSNPEPETAVSPADQQKMEDFTHQLEKVANEVTADPSYRRIPLDKAEDKEWFAGLAYSYWDGKISRDEFVRQGTVRFPGYDASFEEVADGLR